MEEKDLKESLNEDKLSDKPKKGKKEEKKKTLGQEIKEYLILIAVVVAIALFLTQVVFVNAVIPSGSMEKTIDTGDRIFGNRLAYIGSDPERYDIVIFKYPDDESKLFIKRIIGLPGETIEIKDGIVYIDGTEHAEANDYCYETPTGSFGPYTVPEGCYFMMGDNRNNSHDSRYWENPYVAKDKILGKALLRYWPINKFGLI